MICFVDDSIAGVRLAFILIVRTPFLSRSPSPPLSLRTAPRFSFATKCSLCKHESNKWVIWSITWISLPVRHEVREKKNSTMYITHQVYGVRLIFHCHHAILLLLLLFLWWLISLSNLCCDHHFSFFHGLAFLRLLFNSSLSSRARVKFPYRHTRFGGSRVVCIQTMSCSFWPFHTVDAIKFVRKWCVL